MTLGLFSLYPMSLIARYQGSGLALKLWLGVTLFGVIAGTYFLFG